LSNESSQTGIRGESWPIELADDAGVAVLFLVAIYLMRSFKAEHPKFGYSVAELHPIAEYRHEEVVKRIIDWEASDIRAVHSLSLLNAFGPTASRYPSRIMSIRPLLFRFDNFSQLEVRSDTQSATWESRGCCLTS
jgi:hypothetical protein